MSLLNETYILILSLSFHLISAQNDELINKTVAD